MNSLFNEREKIKQNKNVDVDLQLFKLKYT